MPCPPLIKRCYAIIITIEKGGKNMPRKHFELNSDVNKLIEKYDEINNGIRFKRGNGFFSNT